MTEDLNALLDEDPASVLAIIQQRARQRDLTDDECRLAILAARSGRATAASATKAKRSALPKEAPSVHALFER